jgi:multidrug efflux system membrane fusion protein
MNDRAGKQRWVLGAMALLVACAYAYWHLRPITPAAAKPEAAPRGVRVETALVKRQDVPVYLEGLGTVQAFNTATMTARVEGRLQSVAFTEGQMVKQGQLLAQIDPRPFQAALDQAVATEAKDNAQLENAKRDLTRYEMLVPQHLLSQQTLDAQHGLVEQLTAQVHADHAVVDSARTQLEYTRITAPFDGRTGIRLIDPGNNVHASDTTGVVVVTQTQPIAVIFTLPEDQLLKVNAALTAGKVQVAAVTRDDKTPLDVGALMLVDNQIDQSTGTIRLKATFANAQARLWPGQFVTIRVLLSQQHDALTVPAAAIARGPAGPFTYVVKPDMTVEVRPVQLSDENEERAVISGGLTEGERVVTSNQYRLESGVRVRIS